MPHITEHQPGSFCWIELATRDAAAARDFYTRLFGWAVNEIPMGEMGTYFIFQKNGRDVAALYQDAEQRPNWLSYISVRDIDAAAEQARSLGGTVNRGPFDVFESGRMAVAADPQGAQFALWEARSHAGVGVRDEPNALCWNELQARDPEAANAFYTAFFHWRANHSADYTEWHLGEHAVGGMMTSRAPAGVPSYWLAYFAVDDCEAAAALAIELNGTVRLPPTAIENVGRFAVLTDPQGAVFAVIQLAA
ncbi:MAG TPA: VOC family protein [Thermoanaerobaculia bacterium]|jgi:hypothetical protein